MEGERLCDIVKVTDFGLSFTLKKGKFGDGGGGGKGASAPLLVCDNGQ